MEGLMWRMGRCGTIARQVRWRAWSLRENWKEYWAHEAEFKDVKYAEEDEEATKKELTYKQATNVKDVVTYKAESGCKYKMIPFEYLWNRPVERAPEGDDNSEDDGPTDTEEEDNPWTTTSPRTSLPDARTPNGDKDTTRTDEDSADEEIKEQQDLTDLIWNLETEPGECFHVLYHMGCKYGMEKAVIDDVRGRFLPLTHSRAFGPGPVDWTLRRAWYAWDWYVTQGMNDEDEGEAPKGEGNSDDGNSTDEEEEYNPRTTATSRANRTDEVEEQGDYIEDEQDEEEEEGYDPPKRKRKRNAAN
jgi:hypothetical protein